MPLCEGRPNPERAEPHVQRGGCEPFAGGQLGHPLVFNHLGLQDRLLHWWNKPNRLPSAVVETGWGSCMHPLRDNRVEVRSSCHAAV